MIEKKYPQRKCLGCGEMKDKRQLLRVVCDKDGNISFDPSGKKSGRGAYICKNKKCFSAAQKSKRFERSFSAKVSDEIYESLSVLLEE